MRVLSMDKLDVDCVTYYIDQAVKINGEKKMNQLITKVNHLTMFSVPWLVVIFGILPLMLSVGLTAYALATGWLISLVFGLITIVNLAIVVIFYVLAIGGIISFVFGLSWLINIAIFACLICWANRNKNGKDAIYLTGVSHVKY